MSRIGKLPIAIPSGVSITYNDNLVTVKGPLGTLSQVIDPDITLEIDSNNVTLSRATNQKKHKALHGLYRSLISNMTIGVSTGFTKRLELVGVGYKVDNKGQVIEISVGYSHGVFFVVPVELTVKTETVKGQNPAIILTGIDKQLLGQVAAKIKAVRGPEPYKGKGIRIIGEYIIRKAGKSSGKGKK